MIKKIEVKNFRIYEHMSLEVEYPLVIFSGKNASGKTTILEAIYLCATSKSHRTNELNALIAYEQDFASCEIQAEKNLKMVISKEGKKLLIQQREISKISDFIGKISVVMFSPEDLKLITGGKTERRRFLDLEISLLDKTYLRNSSLYKKILKERNEYLKSSTVDFKYLEILTEQLISVLEPIYKRRMEFIDSLNEILDSITKEMGVEAIQLVYKKTYTEDIKASFEAKQKLDLYNKSTNLGTHRDDFEVYIDQKPASLYASEGQGRTICILLKLALKEYIAHVTKEEPIVLLDDVFASLDQSRISALTKYVLKNKQTFITTTSILEIPDLLLKNAKVIRIDKKKEK